MWEFFIGRENYGTRTPLSSFTILLSKYKIGLFSYSLLDIRLFLIKQSNGLICVFRLYNFFLALLNSDINPYILVVLSLSCTFFNKLMNF